MRIQTIEELFTEELKDLYDAEKQQVRTLSQMAKTASDPDLRDAFTEHLQQTKEQVQRLEQIFQSHGMRPKGKPCKGMKGLAEEGQEIMNADSEGALLDAAIIGAAQRAEHYEIAAYGTARSLAQIMGDSDAVELLQTTLKEEGDTDKRLTQIAKKLLKTGGNGASMRTSARGERSRSERQRGERQGRAADTRRTGGRSSSGSSRSSASQGGAGGARATSKRATAAGRTRSLTTTDHQEIRRWAEERSAKPACVRGTGGKGDIGMLRFDFPGYTGKESLQPITWDDFFDKFDERGLALLYQEKTAGGQKSNFNKLVSR